MKGADRSGAAVAVIVGEAELASATVVLKDLRSGGQRTVAADEAVAELRRIKEDGQ
jgi:histidyl-tRNA synthetase